MGRRQKRNVGGDGHARLWCQGKEKMNATEKPVEATSMLKPATYLANGKAALLTARLVGKGKAEYTFQRVVNPASAVQS